MIEKINHPQHYQSNGMEVIDVIEAFDLGFHLGNAIKYILRSGKKTKDTKEDIEKAIWYLNRELNNEKIIKSEVSNVSLNLLKNSLKKLYKIFV